MYIIKKNRRNISDFCILITEKFKDRYTEPL